MAKKKGRKSNREAKRSTPRDIFDRIGKYDYLAFALLAVAVWAVFSGSNDRDFVHWDDNEYVFENQMVMSDESEWSDFFDADLVGLISVATRAKECSEVNTRVIVVANYHPVTMLTLHWNWQSGDGDFGPFYRTNL